MEKIDSYKNIGKNVLEEHYFIATCLKIGLRIEDLERLKYKDVAKIMLCYAENGNSFNNRATQKDIDKLLG